ncbi:hypothetical protein [Pedobacter cryoconitis]|uniref:CCDC81-like prokaryotic HU domain-containing protein n=1 Tax=Pedobacter cryoconitis TaxID=188932 RepID=A0A7X0J3H7_9SPHI|nr:hypothetical protein [Pedobacter cryoconitis]MBB6500228.1 hypothetical protein [Pedobacter cryoconitis]
MDILSYLTELIQTRKAVGVSGLGTVYKKKSPGRYDAETHSFVPPSYTIDFTPEVKEEVLLAEFISKKRNVSVDTAHYFIDEFSNGILQQLNDHQEAKLDGLGMLYKADDELHFEPLEKLNFGFDFYGLPSIKAEQEPSAEEIVPETPPVVEDPVHHPVEEAAVEIPVVEEVTSEHTEEPAPETPVVQEVVSTPVEEHHIETVVPDNENFSEEHPVAQKKNEEQLRAEIEALNFYRSKSPVSKTSVPEQEEVIWNLKDQQMTQAPEPAKFYKEEVYKTEDEEKPVKSTPLYLKIILGFLILVIMMIVAYIVKPEWFNGLIANSPFNTAKTEQPASKPPIQTRYKPDSVATDSTKKPAPVTAPAVKKDSSSQKTIAKTPDSAKVVYEIIGASMHDQKEADKFIELMKKSGIDAKVVTNMSGRRLKMSIATLQDEESAKKELDRLSKKLKIPGIYIYKNRQ